MAARKSKLGPEFWGNFYRLDTDKQTEENFQAELKSVGVQTQPAAGSEWHDDQQRDLGAEYGCPEIRNCNLQPVITAVITL